MTRGIIFAIEEFAVHDGPGIRKTVFFKGCPLHCMWCHNPEGISFKKELMISKVSCTNCGRCLDICIEQRQQSPTSSGGVFPIEKTVSSETQSTTDVVQTPRVSGARRYSLRELVPDSFRYKSLAKFDDKCTACGKCINVCPLRLRKVCGREIDAKELAKELLVGREILEKSGGGITISGGEPLAQPEFLLDVINELKPVHVAIETSGHAPGEIFIKIVDKVDLVLFDLKHTDSQAHKLATGVGNERILENLKYLCGINKKFLIRIPLIPGINDSRENMERTAELVKDAEGLERVELLPYHKTAGAKYQMLGKEYKPAFDVDKTPCVYLDIFEKNNIRSVVL